MKRTSLLSLATLGAFILACAGMESSDESPDPQPISGTTATDAASPAGLSGPWANMSLPWSGGELVACNLKRRVVEVLHGGRIGSGVGQKRHASHRNLRTSRQGQAWR